MSVQRLRDIENGKVMPTLEEFFKLCFLYEMPETILLKNIYPDLYDRWKKEIDHNKKQLQIEKNKDKLISSSPFIW